MIREKLRWFAAGYALGCWVIGLYFLRKESL